MTYRKSDSKRSFEFCNIRKNVKVFKEEKLFLRTKEILKEKIKSLKKNFENRIN